MLELLTKLVMEPHMVATRPGNNALSHTCLFLFEILDASMFHVSMGEIPVPLRSRAYDSVYGIIKIRVDRSLLNKPLN